MTNLPPEPSVIRVDVHLPEAKTAPSTSRLHEVLHSPLLAALVTAFVGGYAAQCVVQDYQTRAKANELAVLAQKERVTAQRVVVELATTLLAEGYYHAQSMHELTLPALDPHLVTDEERPKLLMLRERIVDDRNNFLRQWNQKKQAVALRLGYDFEASLAITNAWRRCASALEELLNVANDEYERSRGNPGLFTPNEEALGEAEARFNAAVDALTREVEKVRER